MKNLTTWVLALTFLGISALGFADDAQFVKQATFDKAHNSLTVQLENGQILNFDPAQCVFKLDIKVQHPTLVKGQHLYYMVFGSVDSIKDTLH